MQRRALVYTATVMCHYCGAAYRPFNLCAATKRAFSDPPSYYTDAGLLRAARVVLSDTYGPGDLRPKVLNLVKQAMIEKTGMRKRARAWTTARAASKGGRHSWKNIRWTD